MNRKIKKFTKLLRKNGISYKIDDEAKEKGIWVHVKTQGENINQMIIGICFMSKSVWFGIDDIACVPDEKRAAALETLNKLHNERRWVKFFLNDKNEIAASIDAMPGGMTYAKDCLHLLAELAYVVDECYPELIRYS